MKSLEQWGWMIITGIIILLWILMGFLLSNVVFGEELDTTKAVIHHTVSHDVGVKEIDRWHREKGFDEIGYHFIIRKDGTIEKGRSLNNIGAHAKGRNHYIGIALTGYNTFTNEQIKSLIKLLKDLGIERIERHHEKCPGKGIDIEQIQNEIEQKVEENQNSILKKGSR